MTGQARSTRRFLGRPEAAYPGYVPPARDGSTTPLAPARTRAGILWLVQAISGGLLIVFLGVHLIAQHILAPGGLRDFASVAAYLREPVALVSELGLLASVLVHVVLGTRAFLVESIRDPRLVSRLTLVVVAIAAIAFAYATWLTATIIGRA
jgi:succinate dehydrogenase hydrophobic anchor subunit